MNIWTNGCFDILHTGHLALLTYAKMYVDDTDPEQCYAPSCNKLFVGVDGDERVKMLKGNNRPINNMYDRVKMLEALRVVDSVVIFNTDDELRNFIRVFNIDYMVIGDQYRDKVVIGAECSKYGVIYYPTDERSTTNIIKKIKNL
jgi:rfaE bifunctional protein nucleotidyltransferase chain/domain